MQEMLQKASNGCGASISYTDLQNKKNKCIFNDTNFFMYFCPLNKIFFYV